jgi:ABC-type transport system involved in multi-copper enzyme maturation permease subunit
VRLIRAELLKMRRRTATYVILVVNLALMAALFLVAGDALGGLERIIEFPGVYTVIGEFAWGIGGLMAIVYAAMIVGSDWNWGVVRNVVARGESRTRYLAAKGIALALVLGLALLIVFAVGIALVYLVGIINDIPVASPLRGRGLQDLADYLILGYPVLLERAAVGFAVAVVFRSQVAGALVGVVAYVGEAILTTTLTGFLIMSRMGEVFGGVTGEQQQLGPEWFQYLAISVGGQVLNAAPGGLAGTTSGGFTQFFLRPVPLEVAFPVLILYLVGAWAIAMILFNRQEIV